MSNIKGKKACVCVCVCVKMMHIEYKSKTFYTRKIYIILKYFKHLNKNKNTATYWVPILSCVFFFLSAKPPDRP